MALKFRLPFQFTKKQGNYPSVIPISGGKNFFTLFPELLGQTVGTYDTYTIQGQMNAYQKCAPLASIISRQADAIRTGKYYLIDSNGNELKSAGKYLTNFLTRPNPLQTFKQFITQAYSYMKIHGQSYCLPVYGLSRTEPTSFWVVPNFMVTPEYTKKVFGQTSLEGVISGYRVQGISALIPASDMLIFSDSTVSNNMLIDRWLTPQSRLIPLSDQVNSVIASTDSWLTISKRKGVPLGIISSGGKDSTSSIPLTPEEKQEAHDELNAGYGMGGDLKKFVITAASLNFTAISLPVRDLMLLEGVEANSRHIANAYGLPFRLMEYDSGSSLSNGGEVKEAEKRHYSNQIIPDAETICETITNWWMMKGYTLQVFFDHLEIFQKSKEETGRAILTLCTGLDKAYLNKIITLEEYRSQLAQIMNIDATKPNGNTYHTG